MRFVLLLVVGAAAGCSGSTSPRTRDLPVTELGTTIALRLHAGDATHEAGSLTLALPDAGLGESPLGLRTDRGEFVSGLRLVASERRTVVEDYTMRVGKRRVRSHQHEESTFTFENVDGERMQLVVRATRDGVAFRYRLLGSGAVTVLEETTAFEVDADRAYLQPYDAGGLLGFGAYEQLPLAMDAGASTLATGWTMPGLFRTDAANDRYLLLAESDLDGRYAGVRLRNEEGSRRYGLAFPGAEEAQGVGDPLPSGTLPLETPWRVVVVGDAATIVETTTVDDLADASVIADTSFVRPGIAAWSWASQLTGTPALQAEYVASAAEFGFGHVIVDARWDQWPNADAEVDALVAQGAPDGVGLWLWYNSGGPHNVWDTETPLDRMLDPTVRDAEMASLEARGVVGVKVDFFESDKPDRIQQILDVLADAAEHRLMVDLHGCPVPRGWQRTYPNLLTVEAVHGAEFTLGGPSVPPRPPHHVLQAFTRNVVGSTDYTPLNFHAALANAQQSYAHTLALGVVFESGLLSLAERADSVPTEGLRALVAAFPFLGPLLATLPTVWDDTQLLEGDPENHLLIARRSGDAYYVAGITGSEGHAFDVELRTALALPAGAYTLETIGAGATADALVRTVTNVSASEDIAFAATLPAGGGVLAVLRPAP